MLVHGSCRKSFTRSTEFKKIKLQLEYPTERRDLRCASGHFSSKTMCFLCACPALSNTDIRRVHTLELGEHLMAKCAERADD